MIWMTTVALMLALGSVATTHAQADRPAARPAAQTQSQAPLNLNTATQAQLEVLPGIGARTATLIIEYRQKNGGFKKVEDLMNVRGVGEKSFLKLKPLVTVAAAKAEQ